MSVTDPEQPPFAWLPVDRVEEWLGATVAEAPAIEHARTAAADWCEQQRRDVFTVPAGATLVVPERIVQAGVLAAARLFSRKGSPAGLVSYGEFAADILRLDPDVSRLLGVGRYAPPAVG